MVAEVWDQQDGESAAAFGLFCLFREMHPTLRSLKEVQLVDPSGRSLGMLEKWSFENKWKPRAKAYDAFCDTQRKAQGEQARKVELAKILALGQAMTKLSAEAVEVIPPEKVGPQYLPRIVDIAIKATRMGLGDAPVEKGTVKSFEETIKELNTEVAKA